MMAGREGQTPQRSVKIIKVRKVPMQQNEGCPPSDGSLNFSDESSRFFLEDSSILVDRPMLGRDSMGNIIPGMPSAQNLFPSDSETHTDVEGNPNDDIDMVPSKKLSEKVLTQLINFRVGRSSSKPVMPKGVKNMNGNVTSHESAVTERLVNSSHVAESKLEVAKWKVDNSTMDKPTVRRPPIWNPKPYNAHRVANKKRGVKHKKDTKKSEQTVKRRKIEYSTETNASLRVTSMRKNYTFCTPKWHSFTKIRIDQAPVSTVCVKRKRQRCQTSMRERATSTSARATTASQTTLMTMACSTSCITSPSVSAGAGNEVNTGKVPDSCSQMDSAGNMHPLQVPETCTQIMDNVENTYMNPIATEPCAQMYSVRNMSLIKVQETCAQMDNVSKMNPVKVPDTCIQVDNVGKINPIKVPETCVQMDNIGKMNRLREQLLAIHAQRQKEKAELQEQRAIIRRLQETLQEKERILQSWELSQEQILKGASRFLQEPFLSILAHQLRRMEPAKGQVTWTQEMKQFSQEVHQRSPAAYQFLERHISLPSLCQLEEWADQEGRERRQTHIAGNGHGKTVHNKHASRKKHRRGNAKDGTQNVAESTDRGVVVVEKTVRISLDSIKPPTLVNGK